MEEDERDSDDGVGDGDPDQTVSHCATRHHDSDKIPHPEVEKQGPAADQSADACIPQGSLLEIAATPSTDEAGDGHREGAHQHSGANGFGDRFEGGSDKTAISEDRYKYERCVLYVRQNVH